MVRKRKLKKMIDAEQERLVTEANDDIITYLLSYEICNLIKKLDFDYKSLVESRLADVVGEIYRVLWSYEDDNETKLRKIYDIYNENSIHVGETEIAMRRKVTGKKEYVGCVYKFKKDEKSDA